MIRQDEILKIYETVLIFRKQSIEFLKRYLSFPKKRKLEISETSELDSYLLHISSGWTYSFQNIDRDKKWLKLAYKQDKTSISIDDLSSIKIGRKPKPKTLALPEIIIQVPKLGKLVASIPCFNYRYHTKDGYLPVFQKLDGKFFYMINNQDSETQIIEIEVNINKTKLNSLLIHN